MKAQSGSTGVGAHTTYRKKAGENPTRTYRKSSTADKRGAAAAKKTAASKPAKRGK